MQTVKTMQQENPAAMLTHRIDGKQAWVKSSLQESDWLFRLDDRCVRELAAAVEDMRAHPLPLLLLTPDMFELSACRALAVRVRSALKEGVSFAVVDRIPLDGITPDEAKTLYWLFSSMIARPVAQKLDGTMIYDVHDTGMQALPGSGVRPDKTNVDLTFHNDNAYNQTMPEIVGLFCLRQAQSGGLSRAISFQTAHNCLLADYRDLLPRFYQPFPFDRQKEHFPGEHPIFSAPMFEYDGRLRARLAPYQVRNAFAMRGEPVDTLTAAATAALDEVFSRPELIAEHYMQPGQIQYVNNREIGHSRTAFTDHAEPELRRYLVRLWLRDAGHRGYRG
jgi:alpha-ketoglutarate-dependent taurine dioxygenase